MCVFPKKIAERTDGENPTILTYDRNHRKASEAGKNEMLQVTII